MVAYKLWLDSRTHFVWCFVVMLCSAVGIVVTYSRVVALLPALDTMTNVSGQLGQRLRESAELSREFRGYIWLQWFSQNSLKLATLFAAILGAGGLLAETANRSALFTLSLPVSRNRWLTTRAAIGLAELLALIVIPALIIPLFAAASGYSYSVVDAFVHAVCLFLVAAIFYSLSFLLSTVFADVWRPMLIALAVAIGIGLAEQVVARGWNGNGLFAVMSGESYFRAGRLPWAGLLLSVAASAAMLWASTMNSVRRDF